MDIPVVKIESFFEISKHDLPCIFLANVDSFTDEEIGHFYDLLSVEEIIKVNKLIFEKDRRTYIVAKGFLRTLCVDYLGVANRAIVFENNEFGKPFLFNPAQNLSFNISHSDNLIALFFHQSKEVGVDIEKIKNDFNYKEIIAHYFSEKERSEIYSIQDFYRFWTMKEALLKAVGVGLIDELNQLEVREGLNIIPAIDGRLQPFLGQQYFLQCFNNEYFTISAAWEW